MSAKCDRYEIQFASCYFLILGIGEGFQCSINRDVRALSVTDRMEYMIKLLKPHQGSQLLTCFKNNATLTVRKNLVTGLPIFASRILIYKELGWESLAERRKRRKLQMFYNIQNNNAPRYLCDLILPNNSKYNCLSIAEWK